MCFFAYNDGMIDQQLRQAIERSGLSLYRIAKDSGVRYSALFRYVNDGKELRLPNVEKLAAYFGMKFTAPKQPKRAKP